MKDRLFKQDPKVSVIMNCHNSEEYLNMAIDSVYEQDFSNWEIILFDNCSNDKTEEISKSYDSKLKYIRSDKFLTLAEARNEAIKYSRGLYLAFLDSDDIWMSTKLTKQVNKIENLNSSYGFCYTKAVKVDSNGKYISPFSFRIHLSFSE